MARKTKEETLKTVAGILDAAEEVFIEHGVAKATIAQIADKAGVSKGAVYGHYKNKIDVCVAVCQRGLAENQNIAHQIEAGNLPPLAALLEFGTEYMRLFFDSASFRNTGTILYAKCENSPEFEPVQKIRTMWEKAAYKATDVLIRKAIATGELAKDTDPHKTNLYLHAVIDGLICASYYTARIPAKNPMTLVREILEMGIAGLKRPVA